MVTCWALTNTQVQLIQYKVIACMREPRCILIVSTLNKQPGIHHLFAGFALVLQCWRGKVPGIDATSKGLPIRNIPKY